MINLNELFGGTAANRARRTPLDAAMVAAARPFSIGTAANRTSNEHCAR